MNPSPLPPMDRRRFFQLSTVGVLGASLTSNTAAASSPATSPAPAPSATTPPRLNETSIQIRDYLSREALKITARSTRDLRSPAALRRLQGKKRQQFIEMMGLERWMATERHTPLNPVTTSTLTRPGYRIETLYFEALPRLFVTANLYIPDNLKGKAPAVLYVCGHAKNQKAHYQAHPRRFAELGFVCLVVETIQLGEVEGFHHGCYREGWFHWYSRGYTSAGTELWIGIRALDLLASRPEVDPNRLGVTGISGGGAASWWIAAADERVQACAPVCGTATLGSHILDKTIDGHCDCMWWINSRQWDLADVGALIAPRPLLIASADRDPIFTIDSIREVHRQLERIYKLAAKPSHLHLIETPGGHAYHSLSRTGIFSWFLRHLAGRDVPPATVGDIDDSPARQESIETLRVYRQGSPQGNRTPTLQDDGFTPPTPPNITSATDAAAVRGHLVTWLKEHTFNAFPDAPPALNPKIEFEFDEGTIVGHRFAYTPESGWRLRGRLWRPKDRPNGLPLLVVLKSPSEDRLAARNTAFRIPGPWARLELETRGTGDTAWSEEMNWHLRRATAWTGRTIASMRVWDLLRGLEAIRSFPEIDPSRIVVVARGEMACVAAYAALLDGKLRGLLLDSPPATQDAPGARDGRGPALEMLNCLKMTDLPYVVGLSWPTQLIVTGSEPASFSWAAALHRQLGAPGRYQALPDAASWKAEGFL